MTEIILNSVPDSKEPQQLITIDTGHSNLDIDNNSIDQLKFAQILIQTALETIIRIQLNPECRHSLLLVRPKDYLEKSNVDLHQIELEMSAK